MKKTMTLIIFSFFAFSFLAWAEPADNADESMTPEVLSADQRISRLEKNNRDLKSKVDDLEDRVNDLEDRLGEN